MAFTAADTERLRRFANLVSLAVAGAEARDRMARLAATDHLTGLPDQRSFSDRLREEVRRARRHDRPLSLILFDIDHFKRVNDTHGHDAGNAVLADGPPADDRDPAGRGGSCPRRTATARWPRRSGPARRPRRAPFDAVGALTLSAGVCDLDAAGDAGELFHLTDLALYRAKAEGRDTTARFIA